MIDLLRIERGTTRQRSGSLRSRTHLHLTLECGAETQLQTLPWLYDFYVHAPAAPFCSPVTI